SNARQNIAGGNCAVGLFSTPPPAGTMQVCGGPVAPVGLGTLSQLASQLRLASAESVFQADGTLTQSAIDSSTNIIDAADIKNPSVPSGYSKYTTESFQSPAGDFKVHFYMDNNGNVFYGQDFKVIFDGEQGPTHYK